MGNKVRNKIKINLVKNIIHKNNMVVSVQNVKNFKQNPPEAKLFIST
jgi:hypothetical protein